MKKIDVNLVTVKKNLEHMEDTYEGVIYEGAHMRDYIWRIHMKGLHMEGHI